MTMRATPPRTSCVVKQTMAPRPSPVLRERIRSAVRARAAPTRGATRALATKLHASYGVALVVTVVAASVRASSTRVVGTMLRIVLSLVLTALTASGLTAPAHGTSVLGRRDEDLAVVLGAAPAVFLIAFEEYGAWAEPRAPAWWPCVAVTLALGAFFTAFALRARRRRVLHRPGLHGGALAGTAGLWASALAFPWCPSLDPLHLLVGHVAPLLALITAGALLGRSTLAVHPKDAR